MKDPLPALFEFGRAVKGIAIDDAKRIAKGIIPSNIVNYLRISRILGQRAGYVYLKSQFLRLLRLRRAYPRRIPRGIHSILFVCHGNIIRSPMAAALLKQRLHEGDQPGPSITSAGLHAKQGKSADPRAVTIARELGISIDDHRAQPVTPELIEQSDMIFVMDYLNEAQLLAQYPKARHKVFLLGANAANGKRSSTIEVADPYDGDLTDTRRCYQILDCCIRKLACDLICAHREKRPF